MEEWTKNSKKFDQMSGEASTALSLWRNTGHLVGIEDFPKNTKCLLCNNKATSAEHLVDKARGGNHTALNVIPVCGKHTKSNWVPFDKPKRWKVQYTAEEITKIEAATTTKDSLRINPYHEQNLKDVVEFKTRIENEILNWRTEKGLI